MKNNTLFILGGILLVIVLVTVFTRGSDSPKLAQRESAVSESAVNESTDYDAGGNSVQDTVDSKIITYSKEAFAQAQENGRAVLFFRAGWCPSCKAAEADLRANMDQIPEDIMILKANYDTETALKTKYGVVTQDTFVQVDTQGEAVARWNSGGRGIQSLLANIQ